MEVLLIVAVAFLAGYGLYHLIRDVRGISGDKREHDILFPHPRHVMPGERLARFRAKKAMVDPQVPEGNNVGWNFNAKHRDRAECSHLYFPVEVGGVLAGQECRLCGNFNSMDDLEAAWSRQGQGLMP